jgi:3-oxoacid CoA-transferase B subunit
VRELIARRAAQLIEPGWVVNLGIGIPVLVSKYLDPDAIFLQSENGILGVGPPPDRAHLDPNLIDASKLPVTARRGGSFFDSAFSFGMLRGGHVDASILGALQVDAQGTIANWAAPGEPVLGVGGAMDILAGVRLVIVAMTHEQRGAGPKLVPRLTLPATSVRPADWIVTELATFRRDGEELVLTELTPGTTLSDLRARTAARFRIGLR